jgi:hypothetical protein
VLITSVSSIAVASGQGKKFENDGKAFGAQSGSLLKALARLGAGSPASLPAINAYKAAIALAEQNFNTAIAAAKLALKTALIALSPAPSPSPSPSPSSI